VRADGEKGHVGARPAKLVAPVLETVSELMEFGQRIADKMATRVTRQVWNRAEPENRCNVNGHGVVV
jgi:hypothetical protein